MPRPSGMPKRIPPGSKYVVESDGGFVRRFVEFPDGRMLKLASRKAQSCDCMDIGLVPRLGGADSGRAVRSGGRVPVRAAD